MPDWQQKTRNKVAQLLMPEKFPLHLVFRQVFFITMLTGLVTLAIGITAVSYLSTFFPVLNDPVPAGIACIAIVWVFTFVNMLGGTWVSRLTTIGLVLVLIPVVMTAIVGWHWFDAATYAANWNTADTTDGHAIIKSILLCLWAFVGVESAAVSTGMVKKPETYRSAGNHAGYWFSRYCLHRCDSGAFRYVSVFCNGGFRCSVCNQCFNYPR